MAFIRERFHHMVICRHEHVDFFSPDDFQYHANELVTGGLGGQIVPSAKDSFNANLSSFTPTTQGLGDKL